MSRKVYDFVYESVHFYFEMWSFKTCSTTRLVTIKMSRRVVVKRLVMPLVVKV